MKVMSKPDSAVPQLCLSHRFFAIDILIDAVPCAGVILLLDPVDKRAARGVGAASE